MCGGGVPSSHPSLGLSVFFLSFFFNTGHGEKRISSERTLSHDKRSHDCECGDYMITGRVEGPVCRARRRGHPPLGPSVRCQVGLLFSEILVSRLSLT